MIILPPEHDSLPEPDVLVLTAHLKRLLAGAGGGNESRLLSLRTARVSSFFWLLAGISSVAFICMLCDFRPSVDGFFGALWNHPHIAEPFRAGDFPFFAKRLNPALAYVPTLDASLTEIHSTAPPLNEIRTIQSYI
jgi:hypothetical protein